ncbi:hypothetical protein CHARACLAT_014909 [Characodon lateralis]|uniref:Uncharacterized protein n=1 Tax=Characodon lateralis TaxID=208331 RepID=A0ABU7DGP9_9TELE|nr:hypothetical protein [Characodon lateralis]
MSQAAELLPLAGTLRLIGYPSIAMSPQILTASAAHSCYADPQDLEKWQMFFSAQCACLCEFLTVSGI